MGANTVNVSPGAKINGGVNLGSGSAMTLTPDRLRRDPPAECPAVRYAAPAAVVPDDAADLRQPELDPPQHQRHHGQLPRHPQLVPRWPRASRSPTRDVRNAAKVCIVGQTLVRELFAGEDPVGQRPAGRER